MVNLRYNILNQNNPHNFDFEMRLCVFSLFVLSTTLVFANFIVPSYASTSFGEDCLPCHQSGITVSTNTTGTIQVEANASFWLEVSASGGVPREMIVIWSNVSHNPYFSFTPREVEDNRVPDSQQDGGNITAIFQISAPSIEGNYTLRTYAASAEGRGGLAEIDVTVGAGGEIPEIPKTPLEIILELSSKVVPLAFSGITILGIAIRVFSWRKIPEGTD